MEQIGNKLFKGAAWLTLTRLLLNALGLLSTFVLARLLAPGDFGIVAIATSILAIALSVTDLSLATALVQRAEVTEEHFHSVWTISLLRSLAIFAFIAASAYPLARLYGEPRLTAVLLATGLGLASPKTVMLTRNLVFWQEFAMQAAQRILVFVGAVGSAILLRSYWALIIGNVIGAATSVVLSYVISPYLPRLGLAKFRELISYSFWLSLGDTVNTFNWKFDQLVLGYLVGKAPLGIYTVADNIAALPVRESTMPLTKALFPAFSRIADEPVRLRQGYTRAQTLVCAIAMPFGFGFAVIADPIVRLFLGHKWLAAIPIIQILSGTFALQTLSSSLQPLAMAKGATKVLFRRDVRTFLIRIPFIIVGYLWGGLLGVVVARAVSSFIGTIWNMALVATLSGISVRAQFASCSRTLLSTAAMVAVTLAVEIALLHRDPFASRAADVILLILAGAMTYIGTSAALWTRAGRPQGPETEVWGVAGRLLALAPARAGFYRSRGD